MYYFVYRINTVVLYWQEKLDQRMKIKRIDNPRINIVKCVGTKPHDEKTRWNATKTNNGHNFQNTESFFIDLVLTDRSNLPKSACGKSSIWWFSFSAARNAITKEHWMRNLPFSFPYFGICPLLGKFERLCLSKRNGFFSVLDAIIWKSSNKRPWIENSEGYTVHSPTWPKGAKGEWRVSSWLAISNTREKVRYFFTCVVTASLGAGNPCITS